MRGALPVALLALLASGCLMIPGMPDETDDSGEPGDDFSDPGDPGDPPGDPASPDAGAAACAGGDDRMEHDGHCYLRFDVGLPWQDARETCMAIGFELASLETAPEADALVPLIGDRFVWIGLTDVADEGTFTWLSGAPLVFARWQGGQPDNAGFSSFEGGEHGGEDCAKVLGASRVWNDEQCERSQPFVCER